MLFSIKFISSLILLFVSLFSFFLNLYFIYLLYSLLPRSVYSFFIEYFPFFISQFLMSFTHFVLCFALFSFNYFAHK